MNELGSLLVAALAAVAFWFIVRGSEPHV